MSRPPLVVVPQYFGALVFDRRTSRYSPWDADATRVLAALRSRAPDELLAEARGEAREDLFALLVHLDRSGWLRTDGRLHASYIDREPPADHLLGPLSVHLEVVGACNLTCTHCFATPLPRNHDALALEELDPLFAELASLGSFRLGLTGGEPTLRRDLLELLDSATGHGLHPCLTTNALRIDESLARELGKRDLVWLNVSLEGATRESNDAVRGAGVFDAVREKLRLLARHTRFTLAFTLTSRNVAEAEACADLAREVGAHTAVFRPLYPVGSAARHPELMPSFEEYVGALARLEAKTRAVGADSDPCALDPFSPASREDARGTVMNNHGCGAANTVCSISVQGDVNPCSFLGEGFVDGNVRRRPFEQIWREGNAMRRMRAAGEGDGFRGGCRARAQELNGSAYGEDPWQAAHEGRETMQAKAPRRLPVVPGGAS